ncbi:MAG: VanZ family protein [Terriglobales bacterium]
MPTARPNLLRAWWPAIVWTGLIILESTDYMSAQNTGSLLYALLTRLFGVINLYDFLYWHHYMRKAGHVLGYAMLGLLLLRGFRATFVDRRSWVRLAPVFAWLGTAFVAAMDEWHQSFIPSRTGAFSDVLLDSAAGLTALVLAYIALRRPEPVSLNKET